MSLSKTSGKKLVDYIIIISVTRDHHQIKLVTALCHRNLKLVSGKNSHSETLNLFLVRILFHRNLILVSGKNSLKHKPFKTGFW